MKLFSLILVVGTGSLVLLDLVSGAQRQTVRLILEIQQRPQTVCCSDEFGAERLRSDAAFRLKPGRTRTGNALTPEPLGPLSGDLSVTPGCHGNVPPDPRERPLSPPSFVLR